MVSTQRRRSIAGRNRDGTRASSRSLAAALKRFGLLLLQDKKLPSAVGLVTGKHVSGSWWSHPRAHEIFRRLEELDEAIATKLIGGKVTFIHPRLLPALAAVGAARERWQTHGLSPEARKLLARIDREGSVRASGPAAKELQLRLLANTHEEHTESGRHATVLEPWPASKMTAEAGRHQLQEAATKIGAELHDLPWNRFR